MVNRTDEQWLNELRSIDTPTVTNVAATSPKNPLCLRLYDPWTENWYTDTSIRCLYPEKGPVVGYAARCVYGLPEVDQSGSASLLDALEATRKPSILVIQQTWPPEIFNKAGLAGEIMATMLQKVGCVGILSNGPCRDVDAIRRLDFQMLVSGVTPGHGEIALKSVNVPVAVGGMEVAPGELIHMDANGAVKFPANQLEAIVENARAMLQDEAEHLRALRNARTPADVRSAATRGRDHAPAQKR